jgi:hypothetical protein
MKFTIKKETDNKICFLDVSITRNDNSLSFNIYRKPTTTDTIIPNDSCHPPEHKAEAVKFLTNLRDTYSLNDANRESGNHITHQILHNNNYDTTLLHKPPKTITHPNNTTHDKKWVRFTYFGKETRFITKLFKNSSVNISYTTLKRSTNYSPHTTISNRTDTKNQVSTNQRVAIARKRMSDKPIDLSPSDSANIFATTNMPTTSLSSLNTFCTINTPSVP